MFTSLTHRMMFIHAIPCDLFKTNYEHMKIYKLTYSILSVMLAGMVILNSGCKKDDETPLHDIPTIESVEPSEGTVGTELTIFGTNFKSNATVTVGGLASNSVEIFSSSIIYAQVPSGIEGNTLLAVKVKNSLGGEATKSNAFKAIDPVLSFVNSATKPSGNPGSTVIIEGKAFGDIQGQGKVLFSDGAGGTIEAVIADEDDWTDSFIVTTVPNDAANGPVAVETEIGISNELEFMITTAATFSPSNINWTVTTPLPTAVSGHKALAVPVDDANGDTRQFVLVTGGRDAQGNALNQTVYGAINLDGTITTWEAAADLPEPRSFHASVVATPFNSKVDGSGFVYTLGGKDADGLSVSSVYMGTLSSDGSVQSWSAARDLPQALHAAGAILFRSTIYVAGGATNDNSAVATVYKAVINQDGQLDEWEELPSLPSALAYHGFVTFGGYLYTVGGETNAAEPDAGSQVNATAKIYYSRISLRTGEIADWVENPNGIGKERSKHTSLVLGGNLFISSGLYSGLTGNVGGSSENYYANINSDGTVGSFNGATGSNTLFSAGGSNLFNQTGISYIDDDGGAHVMILGGAKIGSPDTKLDKVFFY